MVKKKKKKTLALLAAPIKLDLGCGPSKKEGFIGVDLRAFPGVDKVFDLRKPKWPWADNGVDEIHSSHFLEHLDGEERVAFWNEVYRIMRPGGKMALIVPSWTSGRAYGDPTHKWPPFAPMAFYYLDKAWRGANAPHTGYTCDLQITWGFSLAQPWGLKSQEAQAFAMNHYLEVAQDIIATVTKK